MFIPKEKKKKPIKNQHRKVLKFPNMEWLAYLMLNVWMLFFLRAQTDKEHLVN